MNLYDIHPDPERAPYREWAYERVPELVWERYWMSGIKLGLGRAGRQAELMKRERVFTKDAKYAYYYASLVLQGPFPAGEPAIATCARRAYFYARDVLRGRFRAGEPAIAGDARFARWYALDVLRGPFLADELRPPSGWWDRP